MEFNQEEIGSLIVCALRYCFGRMTYMPRMIQETAVSHLSELDNKTLSVIERDVRDAIYDDIYCGISLGGFHYFTEWRDFYFSVKAECDKRGLKPLNSKSGDFVVS